MSKLTRLQSQLSKIQARIADIETHYPTIVRYKSYSHNFGEASAAYQEFGQVAQEYRRLLADEEALQDRIDELQGDGGGSAVVEFRR